MSDRPITWWFDAEIERLEALRAELVAFEALAVKKGATVRCGDPSTRDAVAEFPNGWRADMEFWRGMDSHKPLFKYRSWVPGNWSTRESHNTWRQALRRAESGGVA